MKRKTLIYSTIAVLISVVCFAFKYSPGEESQVMVIYQQGNLITVSTSSDNKVIKIDREHMQVVNNALIILSTVSDYKKQGWTVKATSPYYFYLEK